MPTYLIALVVSDFVCINGTANSGLNGNLPIRSCGRPNANDQLDFGLDVGIRSIEVLQDSLIVKYPLPKEGEKLSELSKIKYNKAFLFYFEK
jgi:aminopeptidase N